MFYEISTLQKLIEKYPDKPWDWRAQIHIATFLEVVKQCKDTKY